MRVGGLFAALFAASSLAACASAPTPVPDPPAIHWARTAAEHRAVYEQVFALAGRRVEVMARGRALDSWAVILDADETVLDNSEYQLLRSRQGLGYTPESWATWVRDEAATALPGAVAFVARVRELGGRVAIVTNRNDEVCNPTRRNLAAVGFEVDVVLCRVAVVSSKEPRFRAVQEGTTGADLPPLEVLAWVGDNIGDFPGGSQDLANPDANPRELAEFGVRYFVLPNPMYGSWEGNEPREPRGGLGVRRDGAPPRISRWHRPA